MDKETTNFPMIELSKLQPTILLQYELHSCLEDTPSHPTGTSEGSTNLNNTNIYHSSSPAKSQPQLLDRNMSSRAVSCDPCPVGKCRDDSSSPKPAILDILASNVMRRAMKIDNYHLWMSMVLQPPMNYQLPVIPFFNILVWETPIWGPFSRRTWWGSH